MKPKDTIKNISPYSEGRGTNETGIKMSSNETPFPPDKSSFELMKGALRSINRYPEKEPDGLKTLIGKFYGLSERHIVLGNGSDELMQFIYMAFVDPGDSVIIPEVTFLMYGIYADIFGAKKVTSRMKNYAIDLYDILKKIEKTTKVVFLATPNNPTGLLVPEADLVRFIKKVPSRVLVAVDAAYMDFADDNYEKRFKSILQSGKKNVVFLRTFSKSFGMSGLRLGYSVADLETSSVLNQMRQPFNINSLALSLASHMMKQKNISQRRIIKIKKNKIQMEKFFERNHISYLPSQTNFFCIKLKKSKAFFDFCREKGIFIRSLESFGMPGHIRVTVSLKKHNQLFQKCLKEFLKKTGR